MICPEIYNMLNNLLDRLVGDDVGEGLKRLQGYMYRLSGQSCKIPLFHDLLKEFIPGKLIRQESHGQRLVAADSAELKELCVRGSIEYMRDQGEIETELKALPPQIIYHVALLRNNGQTDIMLEADEAEPKKVNLKLISVGVNKKEAEFVVIDSDGRVKNKVTCVYPDDNSTSNFDALKKSILRTTHLEETDISAEILTKLKSISPRNQNQGRPVRCLFALPAKDGYGAQLWQVRIDENDKGSKQYMASIKYANYVDESLKTFFDGDK